MTAKRRALGSDLSKVDGHEIRPEEYDDIPEITEEDFDRAEFSIAGEVIRPGNPPLDLPGRRRRPPLDHPKRLVSLRLDSDVIERFRATGRGWQSRINAALREHLERSSRS